MTGGDGSHRAGSSEDWVGWGSIGGDVAAIALRAAGAEARRRRAASFRCLLLSVGRCAEVQLDVETLRRLEAGRGVAIRMTQDGAPMDLTMWNAATPPHLPWPVAFLAPTLDLACLFHDRAADDEWLLCDAHAPVAAGGLVAPSGRLVASGASQLLCRPNPLAGAWGSA